MVRLYLDDRNAGSDGFENDYVCFDEFDAHSIRSAQRELTRRGFAPEAAWLDPFLEDLVHHAFKSRD